MATRQICICGALSLLWAVLVCASPGLAAPAAESSEDTSPGLLDLPMEDLMKIEIASTASLTKTQARLVPAAVTNISREDILASGARSLLELLDIYVPDLQWIRHHWEADHMGLRGIINDRDDKYLLLVNGRVMNERTHYGALSERDLPMIGDIRRIEVIRGPGSALYGPGAVSMVVSIVTDNATTFQGTEAGVRVGGVENFSTAEFKHGQRFADGDGGVFLYAGAGSYTGADQYDAPQIYAFDFPQAGTFPWGGDQSPLPSDGQLAGEPYTGMTIANDQEGARNHTPMKLHAQITRGNWDIWTRYTRGGKRYWWDVGPLAHYPYGWGDWQGLPLQDQFSAYQQATTYVGYKRPLTDNLQLDCALSYDLFDFERFNQNGLSDAHREDEYYGKALLNWTINDRHKLAAGMEVSHEQFGLRSLMEPDQPATSPVLNPMPRWSTTTVSVLAEHQWKITERWTSFLGGRVDGNQFTNPMLSPRGALCYAPTDRDTLKGILARSVRANFAEEMKRQDLETGEASQPETLSSAELRYERKQCTHLDLAGSMYYYDLDLITHSGGRNVPVGAQKQVGLEAEASYHTQRDRISISHGYTQLLDFDLLPGMSTLTTAYPYGWGRHLANWSEHITKVVARHKIDDQWTLDGSLRVYWGFPGSKDWNEYSRNPMGMNDYPVIQPGWEKTYLGNYYLNLGLQFQPSERFTLRLDGYNLLGIFDPDLNKRNYYNGYGDYRDHAAALAVWMIYKFR